MNCEDPKIASAADAPITHERSPHQLTRQWAAPSLTRQTGQVPLVRNPQRDQIRAIDAKLVRDAVDLPFLGRRDRFVGRRQGE